MAKIGERIIQAAFKILDANPEGLRYSELVRQIVASDGSYNQNTIHGNVFGI